MSTSKVKASLVIKTGDKVVQKKTLILTPKQIEEQITTAKKRAKFRAGRRVNVRREGKVYQYRKEEPAANKAA